MIASGFNMSRWGSPAAAASACAAGPLSGAKRLPVSGIGEEAFLITGETKNTRGEPEHTAEGFVRVRNPPRTW